MAPEHLDCISDLHTVIAARIVTKRTTYGLTSVGADSVDHGINLVPSERDLARSHFDHINFSSFDQLKLTQCCGYLLLL